VGELQIRGTSVTLGYYQKPKRRRVIADGWLHTGDLLHDGGELVMCGRIKGTSLSSAAGNIYPQNPSRWSRIDGHPHRNVIAFGRGAATPPAHVVVAETRSETCGSR